MSLFIFFLFANPFWLNGAGPMDMIDLGAGGTRFHVNWLLYDNGDGEYDFTSSDMAANFFRETGIEPLVVLKCTPRIPDSSTYADTTGWNCCEREFWELWHDSTELVKELSWFPEDSMAWRDFVMAFVERYDGDGIDDYPGLGSPFKKYMTEAEYPRVWCRCTDDPAGDWIRHINFTYDAIKDSDSTAISGMAGYAAPDVHLFYAGYIPGDSFLVTTTPAGDIYATREDMASHPDFPDIHANFLRIFEEAENDYYGLHLYGYAENMPFRTEGMWDLFGRKPLISDEGGGPFRIRGEVYNPENDSGYISAELAEENAGYVIRYFAGGIASGFDALFWHTNPEYEAWGQVFGDLDLISIDMEKKPSYYTYRGLAAMIADRDTAYYLPPHGDIVITHFETPHGHYTAMWDIKTEPSFLDIHLDEGTEIFHPPVSMEDSLWDTTRIDATVDTTLIIGRIPVVIKGGWSYMAISEMRPTEYKLTVSRNPVTPGTVIYAPKAGQFTIHDMTGREVLTKSHTSDLFWPDKLPQGIYLISHTCMEGRAVKRVSVVR